jgi:DNA-binding transcriptional ArsR family regulator
MAEGEDAMKMLGDLELDEVASFFGALAVPMRLKILNALRDGERNVGSLTALTQCTQANVSKHLGVLSQAGMVEKTARGTSVYYRIADPRVFRLCDLVCAQIGHHYEQQSGRHRLFRAASAQNPKRASARSK